MINNKQTINNALQLYGSPIYVFDKRAFIENYRAFFSAMKTNYEKYELSYSYKTNYAPYICKLVKELGGYAEVVSDMEYYIAKKVGYEDDHIIYNGPIKGKLGNEMLLNGGMLNVDNLDELTRIVDLAKQNSKINIKIGLRLNVDIGQSFVSRFGIDVTSGDFEKALGLIQTADNLDVQGIHIHVGQSRTVMAWTNRIKEALKIIDKYFDGKKLKYIDLGSGMFGEMDDELAIQFGKDLPKYLDYAQAIGMVINEHYKDYTYDNKPILFTEPGTTLINHYIDFIATVSSIKHIRGKDFVVLDCSKHNLGEISYLKKLPINVIHNNKNQEQIVDGEFVGYTCLEHDKMYIGYNGTLGTGDNIIFGNVGGYSNVDKPPFILPNCAMISMEGESLELIKEKESFDYILDTYVL
ncbi:diaminopimelate decarboxylase [Oribacterium sp. oral taxon 102]|uniref:diaminopimelate decarboxylase n=1 Tax=Oribacterium sp. oral taxon 102 TaxID=671214 RepID=UPI0015C16609|nr:diaminopimelate decarboxylase [Oribacterium sp. oral taxon 102]NWO22185.1 diaminopimelate decarboxylase [Oribacterium sp. oral taxon 102]